MSFEEREQADRPFNWGRIMEDSQVIEKLERHFGAVRLGERRQTGFAAQPQRQVPPSSRESAGTRKPLSREEGV